ncbi:MAG: methyltransferase domain-containing protein [Bdellovibrionales bacterium]|nr:methyltransferase domain-containing protein [Bdellovibrionales bacterium]
MTQVLSKTKFASPVEQVLNFVCFPYRAFIQNPNESTRRFMCLRDERMYYVAKHCSGRTLDLGCGPDNVFVKQFMKGNGQGADVFRYPGLQDSEIIENPPYLAFDDNSFETVTLIANVNHIPTSIIATEFQEIARVLRPGGKLVVTRIGLITSVLTHTVVHIQSMLSSAYYDMDRERGVEDDERYTVSRKEIQALAEANHLHQQTVQRFWTQWWLNEVLVFEKSTEQQSVRRCAA